jgi:hypothetical protein
MRKDMTMEKTGKAKIVKSRPATAYGAMEKCRAVLSVWTERRKPAEVCRELSIPWMALSLWQKRAMEGMLQALEPRVRLDKGPALSSRLQSLLEKKRLTLMTTTAQGKLESRFSKAQENRKPETAVSKEEKKP